jgi:hypothetical protein
MKFFQTNVLRLRVVLPQQLLLIDNFADVKINLEAGARLPGKSQPIFNS